MQTYVGLKVQTDAGLKVQTDAGVRVQTDAGVRVQTDAGVRVQTDAGVRVQTQAGLRVQTDAGPTVKAGYEPPAVRWPVKRYPPALCLSHHCSGADAGRDGGGVCRLAVCAHYLRLGQTPVEIQLRPDRLFGFCRPVGAELCW